MRRAARLAIVTAWPAKRAADHDCRGREWDKNYLFKVTFEGIPNSSMPAWKDRLTEAGDRRGRGVRSNAFETDFGQCRGSGALQPRLPACLPPLLKRPQPSRNRRRADGSFFGNPEKGKALFFDSSNDWHCGACHKIGGTGASVGPDLNGVRSKAVKDLFIDIVLPSVHLFSRQTVPERSQPRAASRSRASRARKAPRISSSTTLGACLPC